MLLLLLAYGFGNFPLLLFWWPGREGVGQEDVIKCTRRLSANADAARACRVRKAHFHTPKKKILAIVRPLLVAVFWELEMSVPMLRISDDWTVANTCQVFSQLVCAA